MKENKLCRFLVNGRSYATLNEAVEYAKKNNCDSVIKKTFSTDGDDLNQYKDEVVWSHTNNEDAYLKESIKEGLLKEGAGAGYNIKGTISNAKITKINNLEIEKGQWVDYANLEVEGTATFKGYAESYYYGIKVVETPINITNIGINVNLLDYEGVESYDKVTPQDLTSALSGSVEFDSDTYGGGYSHSTFEGEIGGDVESSGSEIDNIVIYFTDETTRKYIDLGVQGEAYVENYDVLDEDNDVLDSFETEEEAIDFAKKNRGVEVRYTRWYLDSTGDFDDDINFDSETVWEREYSRSYKYDESKKTVKKSKKLNESKLLKEDTDIDYNDKLSQLLSSEQGDDIWYREAEEENTPFFIFDSWDDVLKAEQLLDPDYDLTDKYDDAIFEEYNINWGFSDEYAVCDCCGGLIRTSADSYSWVADFFVTENGDIYCGDCVRGNECDYSGDNLANEYIATLVNNPKNANTILDDSDLEDFGFTKLDGDYQSGWYDRNDSPDDILRDLLDRHPEGEFIFSVTSTGQWATDYVVWGIYDEDIDDDYEDDDYYEEEDDEVEESFSLKEKKKEDLPKVALDKIYDTVIKNGGGNFDPKTGEQVDIRNRFVASHSNKSGKRGKDWDTVITDVNRDEIDNAINRARGTAKGKEVIGVWNDTDSGNSSVDVTRPFRKEKKARKFGNKNDQKAIGHLDKNGDYTQINLKKLNTNESLKEDKDFYNEEQDKYFTDLGRKLIEISHKYGLNYYYDPMSGIYEIPNEDYIKYKDRIDKFLNDNKDYYLDDGNTYDVPEYQGFMFLVPKDFDESLEEEKSDVFYAVVGYDKDDDVYDDLKLFETEEEALTFCKENYDLIKYKNKDTYDWFLIDKYVNDKLVSSKVFPDKEKDTDESLIKEDTVKTKDGKWVNKGKEGTHGTFKTKKQADAQRKAMFANGYKENLKEEYGPCRGEQYCDDIADELENESSYGYVYVDGEGVEWEIDINGFKDEDFQCDGFFTYLLRDIAYPVRDGFLYYGGLDEIIYGEHYCDEWDKEEFKHDLEMLGVYDEESFERFYNEAGYEMEFWIDYDTNFDEDKYEELLNDAYSDEEEYEDEDEEDYDESLEEASKKSSKYEYKGYKEGLKDIASDVASLWGAQCFRIVPNFEKRIVTLYCIEDGEEFTTEITFDELKDEYDFDIVKEIMNEHNGNFKESKKSLNEKTNKQIDKQMKLNQKYLNWKKEYEKKSSEKKDDATKSLNKGENK